MRVRVSVLGGLLAVISIAVSAGTATGTPISLTITPSASTVGVGDDFYLDIGVQGVSASDNLFSYDVFVALPTLSNVAHFRDATNAELALLPGIGDPGVFVGIEPSTAVYFLQNAQQVEGVNALDIARCDPASDPLCTPAGDAMLFRAFLTADAPGSVTFAFASGTGLFALGDDPFGLLDIPADVDGTATVRVNGTTDNTPVPEPGTLVLVGSGACAAWNRRRRTREKKK
jgi:hypothetical protein